MLLHANDVAEMLGVSTARVYELARTGILPSVRIGRQVRFSAASIGAWIQNGGASLPGGWRRDDDGGHGE
jgi:excisionase family DNA binding protein